MLYKTIYAGTVQLYNCGHVCSTCRRRESRREGEERGRKKEREVRSRSVRVRARCHTLELIKCV